MSHKSALYTAMIALGVVLAYSKFGSKAGALGGMRHGS